AGIDNASLAGVVKLVGGGGDDTGARSFPHGREAWAGRSEFLALQIVRLHNALGLRRHATGKPGIRKHDDIALLDLRTHVLHELGLVDSFGTVLAADQSGHQRRAEYGSLTTRVVEWKQ